MLRYTSVVLATLWAAGSAPAASWADGLFEELSKDFGSVPRGPTLTHSFRVVNHTNSPVSISSVRVSCGCTSAQALKNYLNPGEETSVVAQMNTNLFLGPRTVTIFVQFDRPRFEEVRLWVRANSRTDFAVTPDVLALGAVKRGSGGSGAVDVVFYGSSAQIVEARAESNYIKPTVAEVKREGYETAYRLTAKLRTDAPVGKWYTDVWLSTTDPGMPKIRVPLTVEVESALSLSPESVTLGQIKARAESERRLIVRGARPFKITSFEGTDESLSVRDGGPESKAVHVLTVTVRPGQTGDLRRSVRIHTDLEQDEAVDFQVSAQVLPER
jgi:hypothetical protein